MSTKSSSSDSSTVVKLVWNGPIDSEETFETKMAELKATLIKKSIYHCVSEANSTSHLASYPPSSQALTPNSLRGKRACVNSAMMQTLLWEL